MKKTFLLTMIMTALLLPLAACGEREDPDMKVVLTAGFLKDEVFRIESMSGMLPELMVYLTTAQNQYESVYGRQIWDIDWGGDTLEGHIKETVLAQIAQIKTMNLMAAEYEVTLDEEESTLVALAAAEFYNSLNDTEKELMGVTLETIETLYAEYALAEKLYRHIVRDINPEISDDEARSVTVSHILLRTYALDGTGKKIEYSDQGKAEALARAERILEQARAGEDFERLVMLHSEDEQSHYSFGKGEMEASFEEAAFLLETDEISDIIETSFGYHIIKCLNTLNREETDNNKIKMVEQRRRDVFGQDYNEFLQTLTKNINIELWDDLTFLHNIDVNTRDFFDVFERFSEN